METVYVIILALFLVPLTELKSSIENVTLTGPKVIYHDTTANWIILLESKYFGPYKPDNLFLYRIQLPSRYLEIYGSFDKFSFHSYSSMHFSYEVSPQVKVGEHQMNVSIFRRQQGAVPVKDTLVASGQFKLTIRPFTEMIALHIDHPKEYHKVQHQFASSLQAAHQPVTLSWDLAANYDSILASQLVAEKWTVSRSVVVPSPAHPSARAVHLCRSLSSEYSVTLQMRRVYRPEGTAGGGYQTRRYNVSRLLDLPPTVSLQYDPEVIDPSTSVLLVVSEPRNWTGCYLITALASSPFQWKNCIAFFNFVGCHHELGGIELKSNGWNFLHVALRNDDAPESPLWARAKLYKEYEDLR